MPRKAKGEKILANYFKWIVDQRPDNGVYYADGRSNPVNAGRHSLGTRDHDQAIELVRLLDMKMAVDHGLADPAILEQKPDDLLPLDEGIRRYLKYVARPLIAGGAGKATRKRYHAVFEKFKTFAAEQNIHYWQGVTRQVLEAYAAWLDDRGYAYRTEYLELTTIKQANKWMISEKLIPEACRIELPLSKAQGSDTYCYTDDQVRAIIDHCFENKQLIWLGRVVVALVYTGLRIGELAQLTTADVDLEVNILRVVDQSHTKHRDKAGERKSTKTHRGRTLPVRKELRQVLNALIAESKPTLFRGSKGGKLKPDTVRNVLIRDVLKPLAPRFPRPRAGEGSSFTDGRVHSFRHYFCSKVAREGIPEQTVKQWLGHQDSKMVRHYFHLHDADAQRQIKQLRSVGGPPSPADEAGPMTDHTAA